MSALAKAELVEISAGETPRPVGQPDRVQFNPTTLRVQISNRTAGGQQAGAQNRQRPGTGEVQVSFDLIFDSADEGGDVLRKTAMVERYVRPRGNRAGEEAPPRVQFTWGSFMVQGVMESANIDIDLFDAAGTPLRAKVAVSIKGQDPRWRYQPAPRPGAGGAAGAAGQAVNAPAPPPGAPGGAGSGKAADKVAQALPGESLAQLAARHGLDPAAWRALAAGIDDPLALRLGQEIALPASLGGGAASGGGAAAQDPARVVAGLGLSAAAEATAGGGATGVPAAGGASTPAASRDPHHAGLALTRQGGVGGALRQAHAGAHRRAANASLVAFGLAPLADAGGQPGDRPWGAGVPLRPRFGSGQPAARRDATLPGWQAETGPRRGEAASPRAPDSTPSGPKPGCGCAGRKR